MRSRSSLLPGWNVARFSLGGLLVLLPVLFGGGPLVTEPAAAACKASVAVTFSDETKVGNETISATVTVIANAATGSGPDTLLSVTFAGVRNGEVRVAGQVVTTPRTFALANPTAWSFQLQ